MEKIKKHIDPVDVTKLINTADKDLFGLNSGVHQNFRKSTMEPVIISKIDENTEETGFLNTDEPTVEEVLLNPWVYIAWQISKGRLNKKGGSTRRKKSRGRKTRKYL